MCDVFKQKLIVTRNAMQGPPISDLRQTYLQNFIRVHATSTEMEYFHFYKLISLNCELTGENPS